MIILFASLLAAASDPAPAAAPEKEPMVCRSVQRTGSRIGTRRICRPKSEWDLMSKRASDELSDIQRKAYAQQGPAF